MAVGAASYAIVSSDPHAERSRELYTLDLSSLYEIDPALIQYQQTATIPLDLEHPRALTVDPEDRLYVVGDNQIQVLSPAGDLVASIATEGTPSCIAFGRAGTAETDRIYVGAGKKIEVFFH